MSGIGNGVRRPPLPRVSAAPENAPSELDWRGDALCAQTDPEAFFPAQGETGREAKQLCAACAVRVQCLDHALTNDERFGVWGGLSEQQRRRLRPSTT